MLVHAIRPSAIARGIDWVRVLAEGLVSLLNLPRNCDQSISSSVPRLPPDAGCHPYCLLGNDCRDKALSLSSLLILAVNLFTAATSRSHSLTLFLLFTLHIGDNMPGFIVYVSISSVAVTTSSAERFCFTLRVT